VEWTIDIWFDREWSMDLAVDGWFIMVDLMSSLIGIKPYWNETTHIWLWYVYYILDLE